MLFPVIRVKDKGEEGQGRILGTNSHDSLIINDNGGIDYLNLQCMEGTRNHGAYEFVGKVEEWEPYPTIEFVSLEELIEIYKNEVKELAESEKEILELAKMFREEQIKKNGLDKDYGFSNSAGNLI